ncbi:hypothetical protein GUITHDRAFT_100001 [Guillardia theta CCMP2712]|uniref:FAD dependent oxidoreductase domain-containing protein n=1 Tax=Guillardia theta (strain CCMP2712) TaxID=905079 RepID=L1K1R8_GUITC|nr:hypothetical protein GUITHDRAFT_100001 [Guillardia theta CCMP2712]EKX54524.1 hypothetical protein GUITHDRAFT_100001 [Guillardia theta CCMP2712]|eukprot:XP_005841504.1 hypothetical protein GUITHDRAFT_100001 [Guillardia theta CCMP2712]
MGRIARPPSSVCILGGGWAGLSVAFHLQELASRMQHAMRMHVVDKEAVGEGGASAVAGGLVHPFTPRAKKIWMGDAGMEATRRLIRVASEGRREEDFRAAAQNFPSEIELLRLEDDPSLAGRTSLEAFSPAALAQGSVSQQEFRRAYSSASGSSGWSGLSVNGRNYSRALWEHCKRASGGGSIEWVRRDVGGLADVGDLQAESVVVCLGYGSVMLRELQGLPIKCVAGQSLEFVRRGDEPSDLKVSLLAGKYISPLRDGDRLRLYCGATQEHGTVQELVRRGADVEKAKQELIPELTALYPELGTDCWAPTKVSLSLLPCRTAATDSPWQSRYGIRALTSRENEGRLPLCGLLRSGPGGSMLSNSDVWVLTGFGSRGLIHHALLGEMMAKAVMHRDPSHLPPELQKSSLFT